MVFKTNLSQINKKARALVGWSSLLWYLLFLGYVSLGAGTGHFYSQNLKPIENVLSAMAKGFISSFENEPSSLKPYDRYINVEINNELNTSTKSNSESPQPTVIRYTYPTIKPGELGSDEWSTNFWKDYNDTKQNIENSKINNEQFQSDFDQRVSEMNAEYEQNVNKAKEEQQQRIDQMNQE